MKLQEAINKANDLKPNQYTDEIKKAWLNEIDMRMFNDIILTHENNPYEDEENERIYPLTETDELIAGMPYDNLYVYYLMSKIDEANMDTQLYNADIVLFNSAYSDFARYYNRKNMHL